MGNFLWDDESSNQTHHVQNPSGEVNNISSTTNPDSRANSNTPSEKSINSRSKIENLRVGLAVVAVLGAVALGVVLGLPSARDNSVATHADSVSSIVQDSQFSQSEGNTLIEQIAIQPEIDAQKSVTSEGDTSYNPLEARVKMAASSIVNGYETCSDLEHDITEILKLFMNKYIDKEVITGEMYANCDPNNENWYSDLYGDDYTYIDYHDHEEYNYDYKSNHTCLPTSNTIACATDAAQVPWVVTWIVSDHANGDVFYNESGARGAYDNVDSALAKRLYDPSKTVVDEYGWMEAHYWCKLETWAYEAQCDGEAPTGLMEKNSKEKGTKSAKQEKDTKSSKHEKDTKSSKQTKSDVSIFEKKTRSRILSARTNNHIHDSQPRSPSGEPENSFGQNSQKREVNEQDKVVSDGTYIYAAYGDVLYAWPLADSTQGVSITHMPENATECEWNATEPCTYRSKPHIHALLLGKSHVIVILSQDTWEHSLAENPYVPIIVDFDGSEYYVRVYDTSDITLGSPLKAVGYKELTGDYLNGRSIGDKAIIITASYVYHFAFTDVLLRHQTQYCGLDNASYKELATKTATKQVESVAKQIVAELELFNNCSRIVQTFMMPKSADELDADIPEIGVDLLRFVQVTTFDMSSDFGVDDDIPLTVAGTFAAGISNSMYLDEIYLDNDFLAVPCDIYEYNYTTWNQTSSDTVIVGFDLSTEDGAIPYCYGVIPGTMDNSYRMDKWNGHLRITTSDQSVEDTFNSTSTKIHKVYVLEIPSFEDGPGEMPIVGETDLSVDQDGYISGARFVNDKAYISTYPGYPEFNSQLAIVDLSDHVNPHVVGSLKIDGSLSYIQPIDMNNISYIVGVGYETNYSAWQSFMIFLIDISNPSSPQMTATYKNAVESYTESINDFLSFRYLSESKKLVMPFSKIEYGNNDTSLAGFIVYDIFRNSIGPKFKVTHSKSPSPCYFDAQVPPRSFIHQTELTTIMGHTVIRTDMHSGQFISELDLDAGFNYSYC